MPVSELPAGDPANGVYKTTNGGASWAVAGDLPTGATDPPHRPHYPRSGGC